MISSSSYPSWSLTLAHIQKTSIEWQRIQKDERTNSAAGHHSVHLIRDVRIGAFTKQIGYLTGGSTSMRSVQELDEPTNHCE